MADMKKPLFDLEVKDLEVTVNSYKPGLGLAWGQLFPLKYTPRFDIKGLEGDEGIPVSADRVAFNAKAPKKTRKNIGSWSGKLGKIAVSREKDEIEINEYNDLTVLAAQSGDPATARYLVDMVYDDVKFCNDAMNYRVEADALRVGCSGKQTYKKEYDGDMVTADEINFNVPEENFGGVSVKWDDAKKADGLKDLANWQKKIARKGGAKPLYAIMEQAKFDQLLLQESVAKRMFPRYDQTLVTADMISLQSINTYMSGKGWPQILVIDSYTTIEAKDGTKTTLKPWNENVVVMSPVPRLGYTYYKSVPMVPNTDASQAQSSFYKLTVYSEINPMLEVTMAEAYVQPALSNRNSLVFINTTNTTGWNNGE